MPSPVKLPREIETDPCRDAVREALAAETRQLWPGGTLSVAVVPLTDACARALRSAHRDGLLRRGLEAAARALDAERRGLAARSPDQGSRISRLLLLTTDGSERFYRHVERLVVAHAPRVLACLLDTDSVTLGRLLYERDAAVKLVLAEHKTAVSAILRALAARSPDRPH